MDIGINDLDFEDQNPKEEQSIEEQQFGAENNFTKKWMGDNTNHETDNSE
jgi:hypothetical protein